MNKRDFFIALLVLVPAFGWASLGDLGPTAISEVNTVYRFAIGAILAESFRRSPVWLRAAFLVGVAVLAATTLSLTLGGIALVLLIATDNPQQASKSVAEKAVPVTAYVALGLVAALNVQDKFFDLSSVFVVGGFGLIAVAIRLTQFSRPARSKLILAGGLATVVFGVMGVALGVAVRSDLTELRALAAGITPEVQAVQALSDSVSETADTFDSPWFAALNVLPVVSQNLSATSSVLTEADTVSDTFQEIIDAAELDADSRIGIELATQIDFAKSAELCVDVANFQNTVVAAQNQRFLLPQVRQGLDIAYAELEQVGSIENICPAIEHFDDLLGYNAPQTYLVLAFTTAEVRGLGGLITNWASVEVSDGDIDLVESGRAIPLNNEIEEVQATTDAVPGEDFIWTPYELDRHFQDIGATPDGELVADIAMDLASQATNTSEFDGVVLVGPRGLSQLVSLAGGFEVEDETLEGDELFEFLVRGQYQVDISLGERVDLLEDILDTTVASFQGDDLNLGEADFLELNETIAAGELIFVPAEESARDAFRQLGTTGYLPPLEGRNFFGVIEQNVGLDKLDPYLERDAQLVWDSESDTEPQLKVTYRNTATVALPSYVLGNVGVEGENIVRTVSYAPVHADSVKIRRNNVGEFVDTNFVFRDQEKGHAVSLVGTAIAAGESVELIFNYSDWRAPQAELEFLLPPAAITRDLEIVVGDQNWSVSGENRLSTVDFDS